MSYHFLFPEVNPAAPPSYLEFPIRSGKGLYKVVYVVLNGYSVHTDRWIMGLTALSIYWLF